jgi:hypothetical protein
MSDVGEQDKETPVADGSLASTWRWLSGIFAILLGVGVLVSLIKSNFSIDLGGLPAKVFGQYAWLRDTLFEPVAWVLQHFSITIKTWVKDLLLGYGLVAAATARAHDSWARQGLAEKGWLWRLGTAWLWPLSIGLLRSVNAMDRDDLARGTHKGTFTLDGKPYDSDYIKVIDRNVRRRGEMLASIKRNLSQIVLVTLLIFVWSYLSSAFGPPT